jgi:hypothetical protein
MVSSASADTNEPKLRRDSIPVLHSTLFIEVLKTAGTDQSRLPR